MLNLKTLDANCWKATILLSIIVPLGLLTTFKLTGVIREPISIVENTTLETVEWQYVVAEPEYYTHIEGSANASAFNNGEITIFQGITPYGWWTAGVGDSLCILRIYMNASVNYGFIENVYIVFNDSKPSNPWWLVTNNDFDVQNLSLIERREPTAYEYRGLRLNGAAYLKFAGANQPAQTGLFTMLWWPLAATENATNRIDAEFQLIYYNGTLFKKIIQPFQLSISSSTALGLQCLEVHTILLGEEPSEVTGVSIWIDDVEYSSPVSVALPAKNRSIRAETTIYVNSTKYIFKEWWDLKGAYAVNPLSIGSKTNTDLNACYRIEQN